MGVDSVAEVSKEHAVSVIHHHPPKRRQHIPLPHGASTEEQIQQTMNHCGSLNRLLKCGMLNNV